MNCAPVLFCFTCRWYRIFGCMHLHIASITMFPCSLICIYLAFMLKTDIFGLINISYSQTLICFVCCFLIKLQVASLRQRFYHSIAPGGLAGDRRGVVPASGFSFSSQQIWKVIKENKDLDLPAHKVICMLQWCLFFSHAF